MASLVSLFGIEACMDSSVNDGGPLLAGLTPQLITPKRIERVNSYSDDVPRLNEREVYLLQSLIGRGRWSDAGLIIVSAKKKREPRITPLEHALEHLS